MKLLIKVCLQTSWSSFECFCLLFYYRVLNVVAMLENSMEAFLFALLKTARGVEVVESFGLLSYCAQRLLSPWNLVSREAK